jgi:hypothetical protein
MLITAAAVTALAMTSAACGPDNSSSTNTSNNAGGKHSSCDIAPASLILQTLGLSVGDPAATDNDSVEMCNYPPASGSTSSVIVRWDTASSADQFKITRDGYATQNMQTTDYPGFGDQAYTSTISAIGITTNTLDVRKGSVEIQVSSSASFDQEKALLQKLLDALS